MAQRQHPGPRPSARPVGMPDPLYRNPLSEVPPAAACVWSSACGPLSHRRWVVRADGPASCSHPQCVPRLLVCRTRVLAACCTPTAGALRSASAYARAFKTVTPSRALNQPHPDSGAPAASHPIPGRPMGHAAGAPTRLGGARGRGGPTPSTGWDAVVRWESRLLSLSSRPCPADGCGVCFPSPQSCGTYPAGCC